MRIENARAEGIATAIGIASTSASHACMHAHVLPPHVQSAPWPACFACGIAMFRSAQCMCDAAAFELAGAAGIDSPTGIAAANPFAQTSAIASTNTRTRATRERAMRRGAGTKLVKSGFTAEDGTRRPARAQNVARSATRPARPNRTLSGA
jgi:hypothetical protein